MVLAHHLPEISVSLAPPEECLVEPYSPFPCSPVTPDDDDSYRPTLLTPPPSGPKLGRLHSPLRPADAAPVIKGLDRERFEAMLKASRERNAIGAKKTNDLRKEVALKVHKTKQVERRALFLSKVLAPPSPTATSLAKTPPESPAIFHYTLPSPGLVSPLALFESLSANSPSDHLLATPEPWVEQVDFRLPAKPKSATPSCNIRKIMPASQSAKSLPSLDQISARLGSLASARMPNFERSVRTTRLPAFLARPREGRKSGEVLLPLTAARANDTEFFPRSPLSPMSPQLQITTTLVPRTSTVSAVELSESNLHVLNSRERTAQDMLSTLRRRMTLSSDCGYNGHEADEGDPRWRRHSAPADLFASRPRSGFQHPILSIPGAF